MKRLQWLTLLMAITLVIIIGFQAYWLKDNYDRENKSMNIKASVAFQETVQKLQVYKLRLPGIKTDTANINTQPGNSLPLQVVTDKEIKQVKTGPKDKPSTATTKVILRSLPDTFKMDTSHNRTFIIVHTDSNNSLRSLPVKIRRFDSNVTNTVYFKKNSLEMDTVSREQIISMVNIMRRKMGDTIKADQALERELVLRGSKPAKMTFTNSTVLRYRNNRDSNHVFNLLYAVDSLQDSLQLPEITKAYSLVLKKEMLNIPFTIKKLESENIPQKKEDVSDVTVGFANPVTFRLSLGNTAPYLFRKITMPILFSLFLVGVTLFSFVLLYRNLLRQQKLAEIKNDFISNITHELKTPIATVGVAIEALKNFNAIHDPQKTKEYLDISANELQRLSLLVDKVLKLSMFEKKEIDLNKELFNMKVLTQEVLDTMRLQFEKNKAVVNFETEGNDFKVNADKLHITSVIYNLLDNALKYSKEDPKINVRLSAHQQAIELKISDNGIGIPTEYHGKIFDKFFRVPTGNKHIVKGYGLGLSYVSHIIAQHKGSIQVESELNKGSNFIIKLPVRGES